MKASFLAVISASGRGGAGQHILIDDKAKAALQTKPGQTVRVTIDLDLMAED